jgi:ABC-2 type transport system ATP-binding protein
MKATDILDMSGRLIKHLSKGYKQRVGIAQAILGSPKVIILDEPTVGLDPEQIIEVRNLIKSLKGDHTVILSSHILSEISATCDEVLMIANGRMIACDTTENLLKNHKNAKTIKINVKGDKEKIEEVLKSIDSLEDVKFIEDKGESCLFEVTCDPAKDVREEVSFALSDARLLILEMSEETSTLEDIYLTLVKEADEAYEAELKAISEGADLDEVFADKDEEKAEEKAEEADSDEEDEETAVKEAEETIEEKAEESDSDSKEE